MKHLKVYKIFESSDRFFQTCKDVFAELIDDEAENDIDQGMFIIWFDYNLEIGVNFDEFYESQKKWIDIIEDVNVAIKRLKDEYPEVSVVINTLICLDRKVLEICLEISLDKVEIGDFYTYNISHNSITFDLPKLRKILGLPNTVEISVSDKEDYSMIEFTFKNEELMDAASDSLKDRIGKLKIEDDYLNTQLGNRKFQHFNNNNIYKSISFYLNTKYEYWN